MKRLEETGASQHELEEMFGVTPGQEFILFRDFCVVLLVASHIESPQEDEEGWREQIEKFASALGLPTPEWGASK